MGEDFCGREPIQTPNSGLRACGFLDDSEFGVQNISRLLKYPHPAQPGLAALEDFEAYFGGGAFPGGNDFWAVEGVVGGEGGEDENGVTVGDDDSEFWPESLFVSRAEVGDEDDGAEGQRVGMEHGVLQHFLRAAHELYLGLREPHSGLFAGVGEHGTLARAAFFPVCERGEFDSKLGQSGRGEHGLFCASNRLGNLVLHEGGLGQQHPRLGGARGGANREEKEDEGFAPARARGNGGGMIHYLRGTLAEALPTQVVVDVGGVGYHVFIPISSYDKLPLVGSQLKILTHLTVREDAHILFGFMSTAERDLFRLLVNHVSGIGPRTALDVLSGTTVGAFKASVVAGDTAALSKIKGIGKKTAERIVVELKDKVGIAATWEAASAAHAPSPEEVKVNDAVLALIALGYKQADAFKAVKAALAKDAAATTEELVTAGLKQLL